MSDLRFSAQWATTGAVIVLVALGINFWIAQGSFPGYKIMAYPGIATTRFFSEEINFWPKVAIMLSGQYMAYFTTILVGRKLARLLGYLE